jgi:hypothetical protein
MKGLHFRDGTDIIENATDKLKRLSQNGSQERFQQLYSRWQMCTVARGDYFKGNVALMNYCLLFTRNKAIPETT